MDKILALLSDIKGFFTGASEKLDKITSAEEQVKVLQAELAATKTESSGKDEKIIALTAELDTTKASITAKDGEIATLQAAVETEKARATAVIAAQGVPADQVPTQPVSSSPAAEPTAPGLSPNLKGNARLIAAFQPKTPTNN